MSGAATLIKEARDFASITDPVASDLVRRLADALELATADIVVTVKSDVPPLDIEKINRLSST